MNKKILFLLAVGLTFSSLTGYAAVNAPRDTRGESLRTVDFVGADTGYLDASHGVSSIILSSGSIIVYGLTASNAGFGEFVTFRSTNVQGISVTTATVVMVSSVSAGASFGTNSTFVFKFPVPMKLTNGLNVKLNTAIGVPGNWTIFYRKANATE